MMRHSGLLDLPSHGARYNQAVIELGGTGAAWLWGMQTAVQSRQDGVSASQFIARRTSSPAADRITGAMASRKGADVISAAKGESVRAAATRHQSISVVVPVYNSELTLRMLVERLEPVLTSLARDIELVLVNDASRDGSWDVVLELCRRYRWVRGINLMRNYGQHNALLSGIRAARHETIVTMDDDLQHPPEELHKLLEKMEEGFDVVYGCPEEQQHGLFRNLASEMTRVALQSSMGAKTARHVSAFRAFRTSLRNAFASYHSPFVSIDVVLTWGTTRFVAIPVRHDPRAAGVSNYTLWKLFTHAMNMMTGYSTVPLQLANMVGFLCTAFGLALLVFIVGRFFLYGTSVPGFTFLVSIIAIFSGAQLFALGIMGEYLSRMHFRSMDRPTYTIREQIEHSAQ